VQYNGQTYPDIEGETVMKNLSNSLLAILAAIAILGAFGCSKGTPDPVTPDDPTANTVPDLTGIEESGHFMLGQYTLVFDPVTETLEVIESRTADQHFNITKFVKPYVKFTNLYYSSFLEELSFDMSITNPSIYTVFDVRGIFMEAPGSSIYLDNADDYTMWFNYYQYMTNGFKAFARNTYQRSFMPGATHTETMYVNLPIWETPADPASFDIIVSCSFPGNCADPYEISDQKSYYSVDVPGNGIVIEAKVYDHNNGPNWVTVNTWQLNGGWTWLSKLPDNKWQGIVYNTQNTPPGWYYCQISADNYYGSEQEYYDEALFDYVWIQVQ
jgi:hypothetical protein